jgi:uncharacterized SAM-binding protein YcdF (DUF218 family)
VKKRSRIFKFLVIILALFFVWILVAPFLAKFLIVEKSLDKADAILVLGGSSVYVERTQKAAILFKQGVAPKVLLTDDGRRSGWSRIEERNPPFVDLAKKELIAQGVPAEAIEILEPKVSGTIYEVEVLQKEAKEKNLNSVLIVTSAYHTRRSLWIFEKVFAENNIQTEIGIESAMPGQQTPTPFMWWLSPRGWNLVAGEYVKTFYYWVYY